MNSPAIGSSENNLLTGLRPGLRQQPAAGLSVGRIVAYSLVTLLLSRAALMGELYPFGLAFVAAVAAARRKLVWPVFIIYLVGLATQVDGLLWWNQAISALVVVFMLLIYTVSLRWRQVVIPLTVVAVTLLVQGSSSIIYQMGFYSNVINAVQALLAGGLTAVFLLVFGLGQSNQGAGYRIEQVICLGIAAIGLFLGMEDMAVGSFHFNSVLSGLAVMLAAIVGGPGAGAAIGTLTGLIPALLPVTQTLNFGLLAFNGLLAGVFAAFRKPGVIIGYLLGTLVLGSYLGDRDQLLLRLGEALIAAGLLLVVPPRLIEEICDYLQPGSRGNFLFRAEASRREIAARRAEECSRNLAAAANALEKLEKGKHQVEQPWKALLQHIARRVCQQCSNFSGCWEQSPDTSCRHLLHLIGAVERRGAAATADLPPQLRSKCIHVRELITAINCLYDCYNLELTAETPGTKRELFANQLLSLATVVGQLATDLARDDRWCAELELAIGRELMETGWQIEGLRVIERPTGSVAIHVESVPCKGERECQAAAMIASALVGRSMIVERVECAVDRGDYNCYFRLSPAWPFRVDVGWAQLPKTGEEVCGDSYQVFKLPSGYKMILLSDGMGSGRTAATKSNAALEVLGQLLGAGIEPELAVHTLNGALGDSSRGEGFATVDLASFNLETGDLKLIKLGSATSYLLRADQVEVIAPRAWPAGILPQVIVEPLTRKTAAGDRLLLVSDGVISGFQDRWLQELLIQLPDGDPCRLARYILNQAKALGHTNDDMTVIVAQIEQGD